MSLMAIGAGLGAVNTLFKTGLGISQLFKARQYRMARPQYDIPDEVSQGLGLRQQQLNSRMEGAQQLEENIAQSGQSSLFNAQQGANSSSDILAASAIAQGTTNRAYQGLQLQEAQDKERRVQGLEAQQSQMAAYKDKEFQVNEMEPYKDAQATRSALIEGGLQNISSGLSDAGAQVGKAMEADELDNRFSDTLAGMVQGRRDRRSQSFLFRMNRGFDNTKNPYNGSYGG